MKPFSPPLTQPGANPLTLREMQEQTVRPAKVKPQYDARQVPPQVREAAEGMEGMFLDYLMKVMRQGVQTSEMSMESSATGIYRSMLDQEIAQKAVRTGGVGLSEQIIDYMMSRSYNGPRAQNVPAEVHGGTHEGESGRK